MPTIMGIDPGINGGWAIVTDNSVILRDNPKLAIRKGGKQRAELDLTALHRVWHSVAPMIDHVFIERVGVRPGQGIASSGRFMYFAGALHGLLVASGIPFTFVTPQEWQRSMRVGPSPAAARQRLTELQPTLDLVGASEHQIDAGLIALFGYQDVCKSKAASRQTEAVAA